MNSPRNIDSLCFPVSFITSFILFSPVNEHAAHEYTSSVARKQWWDHSVGLQLWSAPDNPRGENLASLWPQICAGHVPHGDLVHYSCSCLLAQEGKVESVNFHISWPLTFSSWLCHGGEENRKTVRAIWVSLGGFLSWNDLSMANCSNSACSTKAHLHMSPLSEMCHALWGQRYWAGMRDGGTVSPQVLPPWHSLCVRGPATGWFSCACVPTPSPHLTISSASGNLIEEVLCLTEQAWWASFTAMPVWSVLKFLLTWYPALLHKVWASQGIFAISLTSVSWKSGGLWGAAFLCPPTPLKVHEMRNILGLVGTFELLPLHIFSEICSGE